MHWAFKPGIDVLISRAEGRPGDIFCAEQSDGIPDEERDVYDYFFPEWVRETRPTGIELVEIAKGEQVPPRSF